MFVCPRLWSSRRREALLTAAFFRASRRTVALDPEPSFGFLKSGRFSTSKANGPSGPTGHVRSVLAIINLTGIAGRIQERARLTSATLSDAKRELDKRTIAYLAIAFGFSWAIWEIAARGGFESTLTTGLNMLGTFGPAIAAIVVRRWITREGFADAGLKLNLRHWRYYAGALVLPFVVIAFVTATVLACSGFFGIKPQKWLHVWLPIRGLTLEQPLHSLWSLVGQPLFSAVIFTPMLWGEEFGWRSYMQKRVFRNQPLNAALLTGLIWGVWHYPANLRGANFSENPIAGLFIFPVTTVLIAIIFGWFQSKTGSVWCASLAHSATNNIGFALMDLLFGSATNSIWISYGGIIAWLPLGVAALWIIHRGGLKEPALSLEPQPASAVESPS